MDKKYRNWEDVRDLLRNWREENCRQSEDIVDLWQNVLSNYLGKLGDEGWLVLEQVFVAALDCHNIQLANNCLSKLNQQFPGSLRVKRLKALKFSALEQYDDAMDILEDIIKKDETNAAARKQKVAIFKAQGLLIEAIKELADYLKIFMADQEAWLELADLYISQQEWNKAAFCVEELILHSPFNHLYLQRYAEIKYTQGGFENLEMARSYYAQAAKLNPKNVRALYGLILTSSHMASNQKCPSQKKKECVKLGEWASNQLAQLHAANEAKHLTTQMIEGLMGSLQIADAKN
uniref:ER membrane protein complex subunit 2 n=1 Tax=Moina brachiata TaxID=675436 RepID=A0A4Y7NKW5_9CRUS|nr:EOG090X0CGE [Moina brachiata]SVE93234.1 EOG090X0CGE [Moina brachiata]